MSAKANPKVIGGFVLGSVILITAAQGIGSAAGPALGGVAVDVGGLQSLLIAAVIALVLGAGLFSSISAEEES